MPVSLRGIISAVVSSGAESREHEGRCDMYGGQTHDQQGFVMIQLEGEYQLSSRILGDPRERTLLASMGQ